MTIEHELREPRTQQPLAGRLHPHLEEIRRSIVVSYRKPREAARVPLLAHAHATAVVQGDRLKEDPAPDWVWQTVDAVLGRATTDDHGSASTLAWNAVKWCEAGAPIARSQHFRQVISLWPGPKFPAIEAFLAAARKAKAGRTVERKPFVLAGVTMERGILGPQHVRIDIHGTDRELRHVTRFVDGLWIDTLRLRREGAG